MDPIDDVLATLNDALRCDPTAVLAVLRTRHPCNAALAAHAHVVTAEAGAEQQSASVSGLGLLNGILQSALKQKIALKLDDATGEIVGFVRYTGITG